MVRTKSFRNDTINQIRSILVGSVRLAYTQHGPCVLVSRLANQALMPLALVYIYMLPTGIKEKVVLHHQNSLWFKKTNNFRGS